MNNEEQVQVEFTIYLRPLKDPRKTMISSDIQTRSFGAVLLLLSAAIAITSGCGRDNERDLLSGAEVLYERGQKSMDAGNYRNAIRYFEALEARFPFAQTAKQAQLNLIYAYYKNSSEEQCIDAAIQFERENPTHPRVDYALYMRGLALFVPQHGRIQRWFRMDLSKRPPVDAREAFSVLSQLVQRFPNSPYSADAQVRLTFLRNRLAAHEIHIADYYMRRGAHVAALNRAKFAMENFDGSPSTPEALKVMIRAYRKLGMLDLASDSERVLAQSFPEETIEPARKRKRFIFF